MEGIFGLLMMGFIVLVFYLWCKGEQPTGPGSDTTLEEKWNLLINEEFEKSLSAKIPKPEYREQIMQYVREDLQYIYGEAWEKLFAPPWCAVNGITSMFNSRENIILCLMLSKSGLISRWPGKMGIQISNFPIANAYECLKILHCIEKNIREKRKGDEWRMIFVPELDFRDGESIPMYLHPCSGRFHWIFETVYAKNPHTLRDIHNPMLVNFCKRTSIGPRAEKKDIYKDVLIL